MNNEIINDIASLWPFGLMLLFCLFWFVYRKPLRTFIENISSLKLKRGKIEVELLKKDIEKTPTSVEQLVSVNPADKKDEEEAQSLIHVLVLFSKGDFEEAEKLFTKIQSETLDTDDKMNNEFLRLYYRFKCGDISAQADIEKAINNKTMSNQVASRAHLFLAHCLLDGQQFTQAIVELEKSLELSEQDKQRVDIITSLSEVLYKNNQKPEAFKILLNHLDKIQDNVLKSNIWKSIGKIYEEEKQMDYKTFAFGKALEYAPNNTSLIFDTAYSYGQLNFHHLAILNYNQLLKIDSDNYAALNNLGVGFNNLELKFNRIKYYKKAIEGDNTLAASNYAEILIDSGLYDEAKSILENAKIHKDIHPNIWSTYKRLEEEFEAENLKKENIFKSTTHQQQFFRKYITKLNSKKETINIQGSWKLNNRYDLDVIRSGNRISSEWKQGDLNFSLDLELENLAGKGTYISPGIFNVPQTSSVYGILSDDMKKLEILGFIEKEKITLSLKQL